MIRDNNSSIDFSEKSRFPMGYNDLAYSKLMTDTCMRLFWFTMIILLNMVVLTIITFKIFVVDQLYFNFSLTVSEYFGAYWGILYALILITGSLIIMAISKSIKLIIMLVSHFYIQFNDWASSSRIGRVLRVGIIVAIAIVLSPVIILISPVVAILYVLSKNNMRGFVAEMIERLEDLYAEARAELSETRREEDERESH